MQVTIDAARTNLSKLIDAARAGEEVVIVKGKTRLLLGLTVRGHRSLGWDDGAAGDCPRP